MDFRITAPDAPEAKRLIASLDADLLARYPGLPTHGIDPDALRRSDGVFLVVWIADEAVACGAIRKLDAGTAELKRMFVLPEHRGRGIARALLTQLEEHATQRDCTRLILETGVRQPEAIALYEARGYRPIGRYGEYEDDVHSVFFGKSLGPTGPRSEAPM